MKSRSVEGLSTCRAAARFLVCRMFSGGVGIGFAVPAVPPGQEPYGPAAVVGFLHAG